MGSPPLCFLASQYGILLQLAHYLSTIDLFHLSLTCSELHARILASESIFRCLKRIAMCDGHGLKTRQDFVGVYEGNSGRTWRSGPMQAQYDEEVEVRVWNLKCDATNALPCLRCGVNVCEECRFVPRVPNPGRYSSNRRPHLNSSYESERVICYCTPCDNWIEQKLPITLSTFCDCDQYTRWICLPCKKKEDVPSWEYYRTRTEGSWYLGEWEVGEGMVLGDHQFYRFFWCPCGKRAPKNGNVRCSWCLRRHNLDTWMLENPFEIPFFDDDPCYPSHGDSRRDYGTPFLLPDLGYRGPIFNPDDPGPGKMGTP